MLHLVSILEIRLEIKTETKPEKPICLYLME